MLKKNVPIAWMPAAHQSSHSPGRRHAPSSRAAHCVTPPPVKKIEPMKYVALSAVTPTTCA